MKTTLCRNYFKFIRRDLDSTFALGLREVKFDIREVKLDVYGKQQTAKIKLLPSVFSSLYSRIKIFVFAVNSKKHFSTFV